MLVADHLRDNFKLLQKKWCQNKALPRLRLMLPQLAGGVPIKHWKYAEWTKATLTAASVPAVSMMVEYTEEHIRAIGKALADIVGLKEALSSDKINLACNRYFSFFLVASSPLTLCTDTHKKSPPAF